MKLSTLALAALLALGATTAHAGCLSACADGYTYSHEAGSCVPKTVSS